ncbi:hypothetical protein [Mucilaginibacter sp. R-33]|uniref:hypothetical protein n=1 Tax=unclassified Mucilaginibacter TaxID=2617802 RepID=UPI003CEFEAF7
MSKFAKLSRAEMKNVLGGTAPPPPTSCTNDCGGTAGTCSTGYDCVSESCPDDKNYTHNICVAK